METGCTIFRLDPESWLAMVITCSLAYSIYGSVKPVDSDCDMMHKGTHTVHYI